MFEPLKRSHAKNLTLTTQIQQLRISPTDDKGHFSENHFLLKFSYGELVVRRWLVHSEFLNKIYYFCCFRFDLQGK